MLLSNESVADRSPLDALARIVRHRKLIGSAVATDHRFRVVCFSAASLHERLRSRCYRPHLKRWDCEPFGIAIRIDAARRLGAESVVYGQGDDRKRLALDDQYRFQATGKTYDWTTEREWRVHGDVDLAACDRSDVRVFVPTEADARAITKASSSECPWKISCVAPLLRSDAIIREVDPASQEVPKRKSLSTDQTTLSREEIHPFAPYKTLQSEELQSRIEAVRDHFGDSLLILGHHYQQDEVIAHSDLRGDSYKLSEMAASSESCETIVFCGVHFMAETADILANRPERLEDRDGRRVTVILPDMAAGCSMADMAGIKQVEAAWEDMSEVIDTEQVIPVTYINSAASLKAFCGRHGGIVCTSSNARGGPGVGVRAWPTRLLFPDQHLGRNTALKMGITEDEMPVWDPYQLELGGNTEAAFEKKPRDPVEGSLQRSPNVSRLNTCIGFRKQHPGIKILVHPECPREVNDLADVSGSTGKIIETVQKSEPGTKWAIGTELHLVNRLKAEHPEQEIHFLSPVVCMCATMYRIDLPHLCWTLENLRDGAAVNVIEVDEDVTRWSLIASSECWPSSESTRLASKRGPREHLLMTE